MRGLIHIYCGDGKGKTTAALGLALRAHGRGMRVMLVQFMKSQDTGELASLSLLINVSVIRGKGQRGFTWNMTNEELLAITDGHNQCLMTAISAARGGECDLLILDEVIGALNRGLISRDMLLDFIKDKPEPLELVLTGRNPDDSLLSLADYISEVRKIRHPFDTGLAARVGIER
ncbi:MAG: cob(I)yrinic acid a,c-diamide adenosyltransferase [Bacillota bacterium]|nr:cob(I)yrinic acid a,c-diamide adenosyltransferase [Bacillota bacterium]